MPLIPDGTQAMRSSFTDSHARDEQNRIARERRRKRRRIMWWAIGIASVLAALAIAFVLVFARIGNAHEDGYSVGTLINVRKEGMLFSRPAATLLHSGEMKGDEFALEPELFERARELADRSPRVRVEYSNRYVCWSWNYANCDVITKIDEAPASPERR